MRSSRWPNSGESRGISRKPKRLARTLDDQRRLGWVSTYMGSHQLLTGGHAAHVHTCAQRVDAIGETLGDVPLQVVAQFYLVAACHISGDYRGTEHVCRKLMQSLQGERTRERFGLVVFPAVLSSAYLARALAERGVFDKGDAHGHEAIRMAEALDDPHSHRPGVSGSRVSQQPKGGTEPGNPPARTRRRALPRVEHHGLDAGRDGVSGSRVRAVGTSR